jgi:crotonobetainyl-CoA:carnitine CoA-transferase CaiB-like acyl-CoA transferase
MTGPLAGTRVIDFSRVLAGPYATMLLADMGAEVIKVEHPGRGDDTRAWAPPDLAGESAYYLSVNRGKRGITLDLSTSDGRATAQELCHDADIVIQNFRPGVADRLGIGYEQLAETNPELVYTSISAFPPGHPDEGTGGFDIVLQAESGIMHITGDRDGGPAKVGVAMVDILTGLNAATATLGALHGARTTGRGEHVHVTMLNSALSSLVNVTQSALITGEESRRLGNDHANVVPYQPFDTADGQVIIAAGNDSLFQRLCRVLGADEIADDPRFATNAGRVNNREPLIDGLATAFKARGSAEIVEQLRDAGVPCGKVRGVLESLRRSGSTATTELTHPTGGPLRTVLPGFRFEHQDSVATTAPPLQGEHNDEFPLSTNENSTPTKEH